MPSAWVQHVQAVYRKKKAKNASYKYGQAMKDAKATYKKTGAAKSKSKSKKSKDEEPQEDGPAEEKPKRKRKKKKPVKAATKSGPARAPQPMGRRYE